MTEQVTAKKATLTKAVASQTLRNLGASLLPALVEHYALESKVDMNKTLAITNTVRNLCAALIKAKIENINEYGDELEQVLNKYQQQRMMQEFQEKESAKDNKSK